MAEFFDAVVIGAGAAGLWAARVLTSYGFRVALLDAGPLSPVAGELDFEEARRRRPVQSRCLGFQPSNAHLFADDLENPYSLAVGTRFDWIRSRQVGGRLKLWGRVSLRMSDWDFHAASRDGFGQDWPIHYSDLADDYDRVETALEVTGHRDACPQIPDGNFVRASEMGGGEIAFKEAVERRWPERRVISSRMAQREPNDLLQTALSTGRLNVLNDSIVTRLETGRTGRRVERAIYVNRLTGSTDEIAGRVFFLCASTLESTRILLNSASGGAPNGLGNSSGLLGRYLMDHTFGIGLFGVVPALSGEGPLGDGCYVAPFRNFSEPRSEFRRSYGVELGIYRDSEPSAGSAAEASFWMFAFGEVLARRENGVGLDTTLKDAWGIPALRVEFQYSDEERRMGADQIESLRQLAETAGWAIRTERPELGNPGLSAHELGTARMGADSKTSVLDPLNRCWDVPNLVVTDGSAFPSGGSQNPALTIMALTGRACRHVAADLRAGRL